MSQNTKPPNGQKSNGQKSNGRQLKSIPQQNAEKEAQAQVDLFTTTISKLVNHIKTVNRVISISTTLIYEIIRGSYFYKLLLISNRLRDLKNIIGMGVNTSILQNEQNEQNNYDPNIAYEIILKYIDNINTDLLESSKIMSQFNELLDNQKQQLYTYITNAITEINDFIMNIIPNIFMEKTNNILKSNFLNHDNKYIFLYKWLCTLNENKPKPEVLALIKPNADEQSKNVDMNLNEEMDTMINKLNTALNKPQPVGPF